MKTKRVKKWMIDAGVSCVDVARKAGVTGQYVSMIIGNRRKSENVEKVLRELGCPESYLKKQQRYP